MLPPSGPGDRKVNATLLGSSEAKADSRDNSESGEVINEVGGEVA